MPERTPPGSRDVGRLHIVTDDRVLADPTWRRTAVDVLEAGGGSVTLHLRGPRTTAARLYDAVTSLLPAARAVGARVLVNDRVDVALTSGAHGAQLPERAIPAEVARHLLGPAAVIGVSVHPPFSFDSARRAGADFVVAGSLYPTASHPGLPGMGLSGLRDAIQAAGGTPVIAIGGIGAGHVADAVGSGAHGVAVVSGIWSAPSPAHAVREYIDAIEGVIDE